VVKDTEIVCEPCAGELVDCDSPGATEERSCDDGDPNTVNDVETILNCDGSVCIPCRGLNQKGIYIPNVFTPNGDGINDQFEISFEENYNGDCRLLIVDRWGTVVFSSQSSSLQQLEKWDGFNNGYEFPVATYIYKLSIIPLIGDPYFKEGTLLLLK
jgi:gliding motility-associated-like protein